MEVFIVGLIVGLIPALIAQSKGRSFPLWWAYGFMIFIVALPHALIMKADQDYLDKKQLGNGSMKYCTECAELIKTQAKVCRYCGAGQVNFAKVYKAEEPSIFCKEEGEDYEHSK